MMIKILGYLILVALLFYAHSVGFIKQQYSDFTPIFLLIVYLVLLFAETKSLLRKQMSIDEIKRSNFIFSFCVGIVWGGLMSFSAGFHYMPKNISEIIWFGINLAVVGILFGVFGKFLTGIIGAKPGRMG